MVVEQQAGHQKCHIMSNLKGPSWFSTMHLNVTILRLRGIHCLVPFSKRWLELHVAIEWIGHLYKICPLFDEKVYWLNQTCYWDVLISLTCLGFTRFVNVARSHRIWFILESNCILNHRWILQRVKTSRISSQDELLVLLHVYNLKFWIPHGR